MTSEVKVKLPSRNVVDSYDRGGEDTTTVTSSGSYWGNTKRSKKEIIQNRVVCVKIKQRAEGSHNIDIRHKNATTKLLHNFGAAKHFVPRNSEG